MDQASSVFYFYPSRLEAWYGINAPAHCMELQPNAYGITISRLDSIPLMRIPFNINIDSIQRHTVDFILGICYNKTKGGILCQVILWI